MIWGIYIGVFSIQFLVATYLQLKTTQLKQIQSSDPLDGISVIIPFHNEAERFNQLINSLNKANISGQIEFIFVDDYSKDNSIELINKELSISFSIINNTGERGKKSAILEGVNAANYNHILTWDADISLSENYFKNLQNLPQADLIILPVEMKSKTLIGKLAVIEFEFLKTLGLGLAGSGNPILANGANLLFSKQAFLEVEASRSDYDVKSGDDLFLLAAMKKNEKEIITVADHELKVETDAPSRFIDLIRQRQRWFGKMQLLFNKASLGALSLLVLVQVAAVLCWVNGITRPIFLLPLGLKFLAEAISARNFVLQNPLHGLVLVIHQIWYPIYLILSLIPFGKEKRWA